MRKAGSYSSGANLSRFGANAVRLAKRRLSTGHDFMARITAERLVEHLNRSGFVLMKRPPAAAPSLPGSTPRPRD
jgi:hypothetical protein